MWARQMIKAGSLRNKFNSSKLIQMNRAIISSKKNISYAAIPPTAGNRIILTAVKTYRNSLCISNNFSSKSSKLCVPMDKEMQKHCIVPDVIPVGPPETATIFYDLDAKVDAGNELTPTQVKCPPEVLWDADPKSFYTLAMVDPDAPSRGDPTSREWLHWLVGNIPGNEVCRGEVLAEYIGSGPPPDTGLHRYVFLIYKQQKKMCFEEKKLTNKSAEGRPNFKIAEFAKKYDLGNPVAGNFYQAEYDSYVPELYKQLGG